MRIGVIDDQPSVDPEEFCRVLTCVALVCLTLNKPQHHWPFEPVPARAAWGTLLAIAIFCVLNIEISSVFTEAGRSFSLKTFDNLAHQLAYSLSWLIYSIGLLVVGIKWQTSKVRWAALILMVGTAFKIFFMDLWRLGSSTA